MGIWKSGSASAGAGTTGRERRKAKRKAQLKQPFRRAEIERCERRDMFAVAPQLIAVIPSAGDFLDLLGTNTRNQEFRELTLRFDEGQQIQELSAQTGGIRVFRSLDGVFGNGNDIEVTPKLTLKNGFIGIGDRPNEVVVRFSDHLPDDLYRVTIVGSGATPLRNVEQLPFNNGADRSVSFELDLGPQITAVVPQPIRRVGGVLQQARNEIEVYFNNDDLNQAAATNPDFYQLIRTRRTADNLDDSTEFHPTSVIYDPLTDKVRLIFASDIALLDSTESVFRLRIGNHYNQPLPPLAVRPAVEVDDTFGGALSVSATSLNTQTIVVSSAIDPLFYGLDMPGGIDEPGHRDIPEETHLNGFADAIDGVEEIPYNFRDDYGVDPFGNALHNLITETQKQRAREVFEYYSRYLGVQFIETPNLGLTIVTGDLRALDPTVPTGPGGVIGLAGGGIAIMDNAEDWGAGEPGGGWFTTAMHEIGHLLGYGHTYDLPPLTIMGSDGAQGGGNDPSYPGDNDLVHGRYLHRPESIDIDVYKFHLDQAGIFSAETVAERLGDSSRLDSVVWLYNGSKQLIARNDDYYSEDSFVEMELQPGDYYVAVTSTGMSEVDPRTPQSAFGGTTQGVYELRLNFKPSAERNPTAASGIVDIDGQPTLLDGDSDGQPGGEYNYWFTAATAANTFIVDKSAPTGGSGTLASPFNNIQTAFAAATARNTDGNTTNDVRVVRIVGNGGADGDVATRPDNLAYEVGFNSLGQALSDGSEMQVPKGVTVMVDAGAIFKLRRANIDVGSKSQGVDRSEGHFQVLGTPTQSVYFTSYNNETLGKDTFALPTTPAAGDWGGIVFRNELDYDTTGRTVLEKEGIFVNYVNHAAFTFGGGDVVVAGVQQSFSPIQLNEARPAISFNTITASGGAGMAADPNSFKDDLFTEVGRDFTEGQITIAGGIATLTRGAWPTWASDGRITILSALGPPLSSSVVRLSNTQVRIVNPVADSTIPLAFVLSPRDFTSDYRRIGPEIYQNTLRDNSINGLFVKIDSQAGQVVDKLEVAARFNDTDIVHVLSENLLIQGTPGGPEQTIFTGNRNQARQDGRLTIDPGIIVKIDRARIETEIGAQLIAEGAANNRVVFTSLNDDRFGAGGTFDTAGKDLPPFSQGSVSAVNGVVTLVGGIWPTWAAGATLTVNNIKYTVASRDSDTQVTLTRNNVTFGASPFVLTKIFEPKEGDWGGLSFGPLSQGSIDHALITYAGGTTRVEGGFASYNPVEIQQADVRLTNSVLEKNDNGRASGRGLGRFNNDSAVIYVRAAQPVITNNTIKDNAPGDQTAAISINVNALNSDLVNDLGRSTGALARTGDFVGNFGPVISNNRTGGNGVNGMRVRGSTLTTQSVWDDTSIVHVLNNEVVVQNHHTFSGLRLQSSPTESLVVKLFGTTAGFTANGIPLDIDDRIGGTVQVLGTPGHPVVLTSSLDSTVGAGFDPDGRPQTETISGARAPVSTASQLDIQYRMSPQNQANAALVAALNLAAAAWEAVLDDPITVVLDVTFNALQGPIGQALAVFETRPYNTIRDLMIADAGPSETIVRQLPTFEQLQTTFPDQTYTVSQSIDITRANLLALGVPAAQLTARPSVFDPTTPIDGTFELDSGTVFDFDPSDGITPGTQDLVAVAIHEIGHALGFVSAVGAVEAGIRQVSLNPLDLFRLAPGDGATDFTNSPRLLNPAAPDHVFYDGGIFSRAGITVAPRTVGDIPLSRGTTTDGFQSSHWKDETQLPAGSQQIGVMDPSIIAGLRNQVSLNDSRAFDLIGYNAVSRGTPADWRSVKLDRYSNDRNVETVTERETLEQNSTPETAQTLGQLARKEGFDPLNQQLGGGDDNVRLGFEVHGEISSSGDVDVYSFTGMAGSEVWIDIDRTTHSLDSVVELIDASGQVVARSNDSYAEHRNSVPLFTQNSTIRAYTMPREIFSPGGTYSTNPLDTGGDLYTTNPRDAGFRMILPGPLNTSQKYYVRVRSNVAFDPSRTNDQLNALLNDPANLHAGDSRGAYQLQVRVRELDEIPGSTVRHADIRYASNGIEVIGAPGHSPLLGEAGETSAVNNDLPQAQDLGNLLVQERGAMGLSADLSRWDDVDWYKVVVDWSKTQNIPPNVGPIDDKTASLIFDMDYADGAGRPDTNLAIFDEQGRLLYISQASHVADDQVAPNTGGGMNDLSRGSFGEFDPFIGPLHLPANANKTYYVAVSSHVRLPDVLLSNPAVRREPLSHIRRVADDRVGSSWVPPIIPGELPPYQPGMLFDPLDLNGHADPWQLNDVTLYVMAGTQLVTVDPLTGVMDSFVGLTPRVPNRPGQRFSYGDLAMRLNGQLYAFNRTNSDQDDGDYHELDWRGPPFGTNPLDVPYADRGDHGIQVQLGNPPMGAMLPVNIEAMAFQGIGPGSVLWGVGIVDPAEPDFNYLWRFNQDDGMAQPDNNGTQLAPSEPAPVGPIDPANPAVLAMDTAANGGPGGAITGMAIVAGTMYFVSETGGFYSRQGNTFDYITTVNDAAGNPIAFSGLTVGPQQAENGDYSELMFAMDTDGNLYCLDDMGVLQAVFSDSATSVQIPGLTDVRGLAFSTLDYNLWHVSNQRSQDGGHGLDPTPDRVRNRRTQGGQSFYFGLERNAGQPGATNYDFVDGFGTAFSTYDLPGGAHGSLTTNTFSLAGYNFGDSPTLYFNYFVSHDTIVDSFRVFVSNDGAAWTNLGQTPLPPSPPFPIDDNGFPENIGNLGDWRQARIDLSPFFGQDNLRLRFEFSTEGGRRQLDPDVGEPLSALGGADLADGDFFVIDTTIFEFDKGFSLNVPNGAGQLIVDGETFTLDDGTGPVTYEFDKAGDGVGAGNVEIVISDTDSADTIIQAIEAAITASGPAGVTPHIFRNRIHLEGATDVVQSANSAVLLEGDAPGTLLPGSIPVVVHGGMTRLEVATAMAEAIDAEFAAAAMNTDDPNFLTSVKIIGDTLQVINHAVTFAGPLVSDPLFAPDFTGDPDPGPFNINEDAKGNNFEGIYLDDFMIGFTERGEMVLNAPINTAYDLPNIVPLGRVLHGAYQLEMRRGTEYGIPIPPSPTPNDPPGFLLARSFDTNHRFGESLTLIAPDPRLIQPGATFTIFDGVNRVTFEFDLDGQGVSPGNRRVLIDSAVTAFDVSAAMRDAINAVGAPAAGAQDALVTVADASPPTLELFPEFHSPFVVLHRIADFDTDPLLSGILEETTDIGAAPGTVNDGSAPLEEFGDKNIVRDQGQLIIQGNSITNAFNYGILVDAPPRDPGTNLPHPGAVRNLQDFNSLRLAPGVTITNNVIANNFAGGIQFSGDTAIDPLAAVPFGRIVNNTIFGGLLPSGIGILVSDNAAPTILNNVVANMATGIQVDASSAPRTVIGGTAYHRNRANTVGTGAGTFPLLIGAGNEIFVDAANGNFIPRAGSAIIDSSIDSLQDRPELTVLTAPLGFSPAPILAPERDQLGQLRVNDPAVPSPPGLGGDVFKDRGAVERADFSGPTAALIHPVSKVQLEPSVTTLPVLETDRVLDFAIQLIDGVFPADPAFGSGIDDRTIVEDFVVVDLVTNLRVPRNPVILMRDGVTLTENLHYVLIYDTTNDVIHLRPTQGVWEAGHTYVIRLDNTAVTGIRDLAGNTLKANNLQGTTQFTLTIDPVDFGDAPTPYPTLLADNGAHHRITSLRLGPTVTPEINGQPSQNALSDLGDDGVTISGGLVVGETRQITVTASGAGRLDAWIDFNRDGDWNDAGEQIFAGQQLTAGANTLNVAVPANAAFGESYARFRLSSAGGLSPTGPANDGEVEDYRVEIQSVVSYTLQLNYTNGVQLYRDLLNRYFVSPGLEIIADVYVDDNRTVGATAVRQAFADLVYDNDLIDFDPATLDWGSTFTSGRTGVVNDNAPTQVDEAGGMAPIQPGSSDRQLLFRIHGTVKAAAPPEQTLTMSLNTADVSPAHDTLLFGSAQPVQASYDTETIVVKANAWQNARNRFDINADGRITGLDALIIINRLNLQGPASLPPPGQPIPGDDPPLPAYPAPFYDVNGDGRVTGLDALGVFNELNAGRGGQIVMAASDDESVVVAPPALQAASTDEGVPLASSFDVTPLAISVAGSGSTAAAPVLAQARAAGESKSIANSAAFASAIADLFADDEALPAATVKQAPPAEEPLAELLAGDEVWHATDYTADDYTIVAVTRDSVDDLGAVLEMLELESGRKKKIAE